MPTKPNRTMRITLLAVLAVLLAAGCVGGMGQDLIDGGGTPIEPKHEQTGPPEIITFESQQIRPSAPISSESPFQVSWQVRNAETKQDISDLTIEIYDWGDCTLNMINDYSERLFWAGSKPTKYSGITEPKVSNVTKAEDFNTVVQAFRAGSVRQVKLDLTAPKTVLSSSCSIKSKTSYSFSALSELDVQTISPAYLRQLGSASYQSTERVGPGPVRIRLAPTAALPVRSGDQLPIKLTIENVGSGLFGKIPVGKVRIIIPLDWEFTKDSDKLTQVVEPCDGFSEPKLESGSGKIVLYNLREIDMAANGGTLSNPMMCYFKMPVVEMTKDSTLQVSMNYTYDMYNTINVDIAPIITG